MWSNKTKNQRIVFGGKSGKACKLEDIIPSANHRDCTIILYGCVAAGGTGALHRSHEITRKENYVEILTEHMKTSPRKLNIEQKRDKHTTKLVTK